MNDLTLYDLKKGDKFKIIDSADTIFEFYKRDVFTGRYQCYFANQSEPNRQWMVLSPDIKVELVKQ